MALQDPFYVVKEDVQTAINTLNTQFARWNDLFENTNIADNEEFKFIDRELESGLTNIDYDLDDLDETIEIVESNQDKFKLDNDEILSRKAFIDNMRKTVRDIRTTRDHPKVKAKADRDAHESLMARGGDKKKDKFAKLDRVIVEENEKFIDNEGMRQQLIMRQQDDNLNVLSTTVTTLGQMGKTIHEELVDQGRMIDEFDREVDSSSNKLKFVQKRLDKLLANSDKKKFCVIVTLVIIVCILFVFVVL